MPGSAIICTRGRRPVLCGACKCNRSSKLCDGMVVENGVASTCDLPLCIGCAVTKPDPNNKRDTIDYCPACAKKLEAAHG